MANILVAGGAGFIGSNVALYFNKKGHNITVLDNLSRSKLLNKPDHPCDQNWKMLQRVAPEIELIKGDIRDFDLLEKVYKVHNFDIIFQMAGQTAITTSIENPREDFENNVVGTFNLLEAARKWSNEKPTFIFCSTNKVFGENPNIIKLVEKELRYEAADPNFNGINENFSIDLTEHTPYGASKLAADIYVQEYGKLYGMKTGVFRMSCIYGPNQISFEDQGWVVHIINKALKDHSVNIFGNGKQVRDILWVEDLLDLHDKFINSPIDSDVFCVGGGKENTISILELIKFIEDKLEIKIERKYYPWRNADQKYYFTDISKANRILGWEPKVKAWEGVGKIVEEIKLKLKK
ncbi:MAG: GDP-mannose 4,6-dehydratase [Promethearchaeota archaeon]